MNGLQSVQLLTYLPYRAGRDRNVGSVVWGGDTERSEPNQPVTIPSLPE